MLPEKEVPLIYFSDEQFILRTQQQIQKDFAKLDLFFPEHFLITPWSRDEIEMEIEQQIKHLMEQGERRLLQLLYTIDIAEDRFLKLTQEPNLLQILSQEILQRQAYKVYLRQKFQ
jgi:hypothetical protein